MAKKAFNRKRNIFYGPLEKELRKRLVKCFVWSVALYVAETWTLGQSEEKRIEAFEIWIWRKMECVKTINTEHVHQHTHAHYYEVIRHPACWKAFEMQYVKLAHTRMSEPRTGPPATFESGAKILRARSQRPCRPGDLDSFNEKAGSEEVFHEYFRCHTFRPRSGLEARPRLYATLARSLQTSCPIRADTWASNTRAVIIGVRRRDAHPPAAPRLGRLNCRHLTGTSESESHSFALCRLSRLCQDDTGRDRYQLTSECWCIPTERHRLTSLLSRSVINLVTVMFGNRNDVSNISQIGNRKFCPTPDRGPRCGHRGASCPQRRWPVMDQLSRLTTPVATNHGHSTCQLQSAASSSDRGPLTSNSVLSRCRSGPLYPGLCLNISDVIYFLKGRLH
ncbi:hypothetical protein ANN_21670 [Periplaneta americana]|uniref:Uncharacterized protein n=1 Tax=Periplaneta americana TaxID=6978 RepID=A0ABQ8S6Q1_PERAM|nr:hypothetical protein ANN_21670 [Periplaneta americana]